MIRVYVCIDVDVTTLSDSLYSYQHLKAFGNVNHLYLDPWNSDTAWFVSNSWTIHKATIQALTVFLRFHLFSYILTICIIVFAHLCLLLRPGRGVEYCDQLVCLSVCVCVCVCLSVCEHISETAGRNFLCRSPVAIAQSSSGSIAICCVLPVLWMTPRLALVWRCMQG